MKKSPLFRKVNTTAHGVHHRFGGEFREERHSKQFAVSETNRLGMHGGKQRGLDYTPLFRFLLSKVGSEWSSVHAEAVSRLDQEDPIYWMVALQLKDEQEYVRTGESSYFNGLKVDEAGVLQLVNPLLGPGSLAPQCKCCTHTFNGARFTRTYDPNAVAGSSAYRVA